MSHFQAVYPKQENFLHPDTLQERSWDELEQLGFGDIGRHLLRWAHGGNNSVLNTGYCRWQRILMYGIESGPGYDAAVFRTQGDFGSESGNTSMLQRYAKVIRFHGSDVVRVRYLMYREFPQLGSDVEEPYLVAMFDKDYPVYNLPQYVSDRDSTIAVDLANHILSGTFLFTDQEPMHPNEPPLTKDMKYQSFTSIIPIELPF